MLGSLNADELIREVETQNTPTQLEVALAKKLAEVQKIIEKVQDAADTAF